MNKLIILLFLLLVTLKSFSQKKIAAEILIGIGFNNSNISLINLDIENYNVYTTQINTTYKFKLYKKFSAETGIGLQWYFSSGIIAFSNFKTTSLRLNLPFIISYPVLKKTSLGLGLSFSNNKDFVDLKLRADDNLRAALVIKGNHTLKDTIDLILVIKPNLSNTPNSYLVNQPNTDISLGISYKLF